MKRWQNATIALIAIMTFIRLVFIASSDLSDTEAYYVSWSRWLDLSYYDHPPLVAWSTWLVEHVFGQSAFTLRLVTVACTAIFTFLLYRLTMKMFSARAAFVAVAIVSALPAFAMTSVLVNPEGLLAPLWLAFLILLWDLRDHDEAWRPLALGAVIGVGFLAKYTALLEVPIALAFVMASKPARRWLARPSFWFSGVVALAITTPVIVWNAERGFPSVRLHLVERAAAPSLANYAWNALHTLVTQLTLFHPLAFPGLMVVAVLTMRRAKRDERFQFLAWTSVPALAFFWLMMVRVSDAEPHWTMVAYMPLAIAAGGLVDGAFAVGEARALKVYLATTAAFSATLLAAYLVHMRTELIFRVIPDSMYDARVDPYNETVGWSRIRSAIVAESDALGGAVVVGNHNVLCGHLDVALDDQPNVYCASPRRTEFDFVDRVEVPARSPVVYVETDRYALDPARALPDRTCTLADTVVLKRATHTIERVHLYACPALELHDRVQASLP